MRDFNALPGVHKADAAVVGGGWTGLLTAHFLAQRGIQVILLTAGEPGTRQQETPAILRPSASLLHAHAHHGEQVVAHIAQLRHAMSHLPASLSPSIAYQETDFYTYCRTPSQLFALRELQSFGKHFGLPCETAEDAGGCPFPVELSLRAPGLLIDSASLSDALCRSIRQSGGDVFPHTRVLNANALQVFTADARVDAGCVLLCTGKPLGLTRRSLLAQLETRTIVHCRLTGPAPLHTAQFPAMPQDMTLLPVPGGAEALWDAGRTGTREAEERTARFVKLLRTRLPDWEAGPLHFRLHTISLDGLPVVGSFRTHNGHILCACGAADLPQALLCARALSRLALRKPSAADLALRPDRLLPRALRRRQLIHLRRWRSFSVLRTTPRCSHCRCRLRYHARARWWGCPYCGSAFGVLGERLGGPALSDVPISAAQRPRW